MPSHDSQLSILIPTYNDVCVDLVGSLCQQAGLIPRLSYEILVADDGSTMAESVKANEVINTYAHCKYLKREKNEGRSAIRNFLAQQAQYSLLLFIDSHMSVVNDDFLATYLSSRSHSLVYGGYTVHEDDGKRSNLRYLYEMSCVDAQAAANRSASPYSNFHTSNFLIHREIMLARPLDERFKKYGYEDVLFGKQLKKAGIEIFHIDNPLGFNRFESNQRFLEKTEEGLRTLYEFRNELNGYSRLLELSNRLQKWHMSGLVRCLYDCFHLSIKKNLQGEKPSLFLFKVYRLTYFFSLMR